MRKAAIITAMTLPISIIIPAYNVEEWLDRAIQSLQAQTFLDYEILLVDDGSTDGTPLLCDKLAGEDSRICVIHQQNSGAAAARNTAIKQARGKYLYFMDADDWCEPEMLGEMYEFAEEHDLQLVVTGFYIDTYYGSNKYYREQRNAPDAIYNQHDFREASIALFDAQLLYAPWNKLYLHDYLTEKGIEFPSTFWDDLPFNLDVIREIERVGCIDAHYYHFLRARSEAENTRYRPDMYSKREEENSWMRELYEQWGLDTPRVREFLGRRHAERLLGCIENLTCKDCQLSKEEILGKIDDILNTPSTQQALRDANPQTKILKTLFAPMAAGNVKRVYQQSRLISWVKRNSTNLFARLKANR